MNKNVIDRIDSKNLHYRYINSSNLFGGRTGTTSPMANRKVLTKEILKDFKEDISAAFDEGYEDEGDEWLACYRPFFHSEEDWGIFFHYQRMQSFILRFAKLYNESPFVLGRELVKKVLHHEQFHFLTEYTSAIKSQLLGTDVDSNVIYEEFIRSNPGTRKLEEAMANAYALTRTDYETDMNSNGFKNISSRDHLIKCLCDICGLAGAGYRDYLSVSTDPSQSTSFTPLPDMLWFKHFFESFSAKLDRHQLPKVLIPRENNWSFTNKNGQILEKRLLSKVPIYLFKE
ncbi:hypothetical protein OAC75_02420 [Pseudomonadales bacterium]|nr:hypothetical protein [Pseudomonadales bacterium]